MAHFIPPSSFEKACEALRSEKEKVEALEKALAAEKKAHLDDVTSAKNGLENFERTLLSMQSSRDTLNAKVTELLRVQQDLAHENTTLRTEIARLTGEASKAKGAHAKHVEVLEAAIDEQRDAAEKATKRLEEHRAEHLDLAQQLKAVRVFHAGECEKVHVRDAEILRLRQEHEDQLERMNAAIAGERARAEALAQSAPTG